MHVKWVTRTLLIHAAKTARAVLVALDAFIVGTVISVWIARIVMDVAGVWIVTIVWKQHIHILAMIYTVVHTVLILQDCIIAVTTYKVKEMYNVQTWYRQISA